MLDPTHTAIGTWSGGRFMRFGEPLDDDRLAALVRPGGGIGTVITADAYGAGDCFAAGLAFGRAEGDFEWGLAFHPYAEDLETVRTSSRLGWRPISGSR